MIKKIRPTKNWIRFKQYYNTWLGWLEQQFCKPRSDGTIDCICSKARRMKLELKDLSKEHCELKENACKEYCLKYCDHFFDYSTKYYPNCPEQSNQEDQLLPSHKDIEEYLDNFIKGKMCLA